MKRKIYYDSKQPAGLVLADDSRWSIVDGDNIGSLIVSRLADVMQLRFQQGAGNRLLVLAERRKNAYLHHEGFSHSQPSSRHPDTATDHFGALCEDLCTSSRGSAPLECSKTVICYVNPAENNDMLALQLMRVARIISKHSQARGGLLLHGALAQREGFGVILAGPGDGGKTTASLRLPKPWQSLCDDTTLVVREANNTYRAHPWPTWSRFMFGGSGGTWNVQQSVPLKAIFFLSKALHEQVRPIGVGESVGMLVSSAEQVWGQIPRRMPKEEVRTFRLQRFNNICSLAKAVPCYRLYLGLEGSFWKEIERVIGGNGGATDG